MSNVIFINRFRNNNRPHEPSAEDIRAVIIGCANELEGVANWTRCPVWVNAIVDEIRRVARE